jgi:hypothetical protein
MQIKAADDKQPDLDALTALLERPDVDAPTRRRMLDLASLNLSSPASRGLQERPSAPGPRLAVINGRRGGPDSPRQRDLLTQGHAGRTGRANRLFTAIGPRSMSHRSGDPREGGA